MTTYFVYWNKYEHAHRIVTRWDMIAQEEGDVFLASFDNYDDAIEFAYAKDEEL